MHDDCPFEIERSDDDVPIAELGDGERARRRVGRAVRLRRTAAVVLVASLATAGAVVASHATHDRNAPRRRVTTPTSRAPKTIDHNEARIDVLAALLSTRASGSFTLHSRMSASPDSGSQTIVADGTVNVDPIAMVATSNVSGLGVITSRVNGTDVWESGGGNYGMTDAASGPGAPLSQFAGLVVGTLGPREGSVAMSSLASPTGYLDLAEIAISDASWFEDTVLDGRVVHEYEVEVDGTRVLDRPDLTSEEFKTASDAVKLLREQGYRGTTMRLSIDADGFIRRSQTDVHFADGGSVSADTTFSNFGCSTVETSPYGPQIVPNPAGC